MTSNCEALIDLFINLIFLIILHYLTEDTNLIALDMNVNNTINYET